MRIIVTGALGHIGSELIRELPAALPGAQIVMLDNLSTQRCCSLFNLPAEGSYLFVEGDVLTADLSSLFAGAAVVVHFAAITDAPSSFAICAQVEEMNFAGTQRGAQASVAAGGALV